jgi:hypothetical protein
MTFSHRASTRPALAVLLVLGCAACTLIGLGPDATRMTYLDMRDPILCELPVVFAAAVSDTIDPTTQTGDVEIAYPSTGEAMAELTIPMGALTQTTVFTLDAPDSTHLVAVTVEATAGGVDVHDFNEELQLVLIAAEERNCGPFEPDSLGVFLYNLGDNVFWDVRGDFVPTPAVARGGELEDPYGFPPRARTSLDHFSGFILAQGRR